VRGPGQRRASDEGDEGEQEEGGRRPGRWCAWRRASRARRCRGGRGSRPRRRARRPGSRPSRALGDSPRRARRGGRGPLEWSPSAFPRDRRVRRDSDGDHSIQGGRSDMFLGRCRALASRWFRVLRPVRARVASDSSSGVTLATLVGVVGLAFSDAQEARAAASDPGAVPRALTFGGRSQPARTIGLEALLRACGEQTIEVEDPYHGRRMRYRALSFRCVLDEGFAARGGAASLAGESLLLRARDGYTRPAAGALVVDPNAHLAFGEPDLSPGPGAAGGDAPRFRPIDRRQVDPRALLPRLDRRRARGSPRASLALSARHDRDRPLRGGLPAHRAERSSEVRSGLARLCALPGILQCLPRDQRRGRKGRTGPERPEEHRRIPTPRADPRLRPQPRGDALHEHARPSASVGRRSRRADRLLRGDENAQARSAGAAGP
jgi:hypothetical protein